MDAMAEKRFEGVLGTSWDGRLNALKFRAKLELLRNSSFHASQTGSEMPGNAPHLEFQPHGGSTLDLDFGTRIKEWVNLDHHKAIA